MYIHVVILIRKGGQINENNEFELNEHVKIVKLKVYS